MFPTSFGADLPRQPRSSSGFLVAMHLQGVLQMRRFFLADSSDSLGGHGPRHQNTIEYRCLSTKAGVFSYTSGIRKLL